MVKVNPSKRQINEGESLTTTFSGLKKGAKLYYRIIGSNVNKDDFSVGGITGTITANKSGTAKLTHSFKADKLTEGTETFRIEVFSDQNLRQRVGQSDAITIIDKSASPTKKPGATTANNTSTPKSSVDFGLGQVKGDTVYTSNKLDNISGAIIPGFGVPRDAITGISHEFEWSNKYIVFTAKVTANTKAYPNIDSSSTLRMAWKGDFLIKNGNLTAGRIDEIGLVSYGERTTGKGSAHSWVSAKNPFAIDSKNPLASTPKIWNNSNLIANYNKLNGAVQFGDKEVDMQPFGNGKIFTNGWQDNPFAPDIV
jgi:hypothetical protein